MLRKLVKYDLKWVNKLMVIYFSIALILSILTRISSLFTESFIGNIIYLVLRGCVISCFVSIIINCIIRIWVRFKISLYKDESYLTHTLPVSKCTLYNSKIISLLISLIISVIVIIICTLIAFLNTDMINFLKDLFSNKDITFIVISIIITSILEFIYMANCGIVGILIGHKKNNNKVFKSVFIGIALYFIVQLIILGLIYAIGLINSDINEMFNNISNYSGDTANVKSLVVIVNSMYTLFIVLMYFIGRKIFKKGINVD